MSSFVRRLANMISFCEKNINTLSVIKMVIMIANLNHYA